MGWILVNRQSVISPVSSPSVFPAALQNLSCSLLRLPSTQDFRPLKTSPQPLKSHSSPCRPQRVTVPELRFRCDLGREAGVSLREGRRARKDGDGDAEVAVCERGMCGVPGAGVAGCEDGAGCFHEEWKRERKLGESGVEGEETVVEVGEVVVDVEAEVEVEGEDLWEKEAGREIERVIVADWELVSWGVISDAGMISENAQPGSEPMWDSRPALDLELAVRCPYTLEYLKVKTK